MKLINAEMIIAIGAEDWHRAYGIMCRHFRTEEQIEPRIYVYESFANDPHVVLFQNNMSYKWYGSIGFLEDAYHAPERSASMYIRVPRKKLYTAGGCN